MLRKAMGVVVLIVLSALNVHLAHAQADERRFEVGGQFSLLRLTTLRATSTTFPCILAPCPVAGAFSSSRETELGFGGRFGYNFSEYFGLEAEGNFFPRDRDSEGGQKMQGLLGARVGKRFDKVGLFVKARPGFVRFGKGDYVLVRACVQTFPPPLACFDPRSKTNFAFDLGGVIEWYPSKRTIVRFDAGDTMIHFGNRTVGGVDLPPGDTGPTRLVAIPQAAETTHNLQGSIGFGYRF